MNIKASLTTCRAEDVTLQSLLNGFLREIDAGVITRIDGKAGVEISLHHCKGHLRVVIDYLSQTGPHAFGARYVRFEGMPDWQPASLVQTISLVAQECFARHPVTDPHKLPEFMRAVFDSNAQISKLMRTQQSHDRVSTFLAAERSLAFGHWLHPTPKSRDGMTDWHLNTYAPEFGGSFQLVFFAAHHSIVRAKSADVDTQTMLRDLPGMPTDIDLRPDECLIPAHPLQADALMLRQDIQALMRAGMLRRLGRMGGTFAATSSVRTVYAADCPWMLKFSIPVRLTNSLRATKRNELDVGVTMARLMEKLSFNRNSAVFQIINDPAYLTIDIPGQRESGFELILRDNPFPAGKDRNVFNLAALTADPMPGDVSLLAQAVTETAQTHGVAVGRMARTWFDAYLSCCFDPLLNLYDTQGIALEAHQQNALVRLDGGLPVAGYFRDNQGYLVARQALPRLARLVPEISDLAVLAYDTAHINSRLAYYLVVNQIFAVIRRLGRDGLTTEQVLLAQMVRHLQGRHAGLDGPGAGFIAHLLTAPSLQTKANLLTRVQDIDELEEAEQEGLFVDMPNPIAAIAHAMTDAPRPTTEAWIDALA